jgi:hypothetical protein
MDMRTARELDAYQAEILEMLFERTAIAEEIVRFRCTPSGEVADEHLVVAAPLGEQDRQYLALNLPAGSTNVFVALTDNRPEAIARIIANVEDHERRRGRALGLGETIITDKGSLRPEVPYAILLSRTATFDDLAALPDTAMIAGRATSFFLAVPLTRAEYEFKIEHGLDALHSRFEAEGKRIAF